MLIAIDRHTIAMPMTARAPPQCHAWPHRRTAAYAHRELCSYACMYTVACCGMRHHARRRYVGTCTESDSARNCGSRAAGHRHRTAAAPLQRNRRRRHTDGVRIPPLPPPASAPSTPRGPAAPSGAATAPPPYRRLIRCPAASPPYRNRIMIMHGPAPHRHRPHSPSPHPPSALRRRHTIVAAPPPRHGAAPPPSAATSPPQHYHHCR